MRIASSSLGLLLLGSLLVGCPSGGDAPAAESNTSESSSAPAAPSEPAAPSAQTPEGSAAAPAGDAPAAQAAAGQEGAQAAAAQAVAGQAAAAAGGDYGNFQLGAGFLPDPQTGSGSTGGPVDASTFGPGCVGSIDTSPDHRIEVTSDVNLRLFVDSDVDSTLVVRGPAGTFCDDDSHGNLDPELNVALTPGTYDVYVGHLGSQSGRYTLTLTENMGMAAAVRTGTPGDSCANPLPLPIANGAASFSGTLNGFTNTLGDRIEVTGYSWSGSDVFFAVEAPANSQITATLNDNGSFDGGLYALTDCANPVGSVFAGLDTTPTRPLTFTNANHTRFLLVVDAWQGATSGNFSLSLQVAGGAPQAGAVACTVGAPIEVLWNGTWYAATVKQTRADGQCFIGYDGWAESWDEWVGADRMRARQN